MAAALQVVAEHLASASKFRPPSLALMTTHGRSCGTGERQPTLTCSQVIKALGPVVGRIGHWVCNRSGSAETWAGVAAGLPSLRRLSLVDGTWAAVALESIAQHLTDLERLDVGCRYDGSAYVERGAWLGLAAARACPLLLVADPPPCGQVVELCSAAQVKAFGRENITLGTTCAAGWAGQGLCHERV